ncbi:XdhC family protein [Hoeflea poritis]|uniref:XdhC family protein n=1 Tax=Hoeflea poritis TaxID=2993659 RepID=A0ABT4VU13_9HYPH|nr:XdhC family protein [Hoeflea poritis]MDA4848207.1 XdhC family protein [Hoeflea poritis]
MDTDLLQQLNVERQARRAAILITDLENGGGRLLREGEPAGGGLEEAAERAFRSGKSTIVEADGRSLFLNVHVPPARLVVVGAVHISQALAPMAAIAGFDMTVIDPRTAFATEERFGSVELLAEWPDEALERAPLDAYTALAAVTHDPKIDDFPLKSALESGCFYVGALGSRKTHAKRVERLKALGLEEAQIDRIASPIGLDIGASSPAEIAVAILAEVIAALRKRQVAAS